jgi:uncharacterized protein (DUF1697 family)
VQCDLARDKIAGVAFVKRDCRRPPTGAASMRGRVVAQSQRVTKSVTAKPPTIAGWGLSLMTKFIALLRAVNVGGTGKLAMADLKSMCADAGFDRIETYIASGNVVFESKETAARVQSELESRLCNHARRPIRVFVRTAPELQEVLRGNPFPEAEPRLTYVFFLGSRPPPDAIASVRHRVDEELRVGKREIYVRYPSGMGQSKLVVPSAKNGTARNMNTIAKLVAMSS